jgi:hypothetical protein
MNKIYVILAIFLLMLLTGCGSQGTLVLQITDQPTPLQLETVDVTLSEVQVHFVGEDNSTNTTTGWHTIVEGPVTYDLMQLINVTELLGQKDLPVGKYTQIRLVVDSATATIAGESVELEIPSGEVKLVHGFDIEPGKTLTLTLDFDAQESIHAAGPKYIMRPTIKVLQG